jgi:hypothetical protein
MMQVTFVGEAFLQTLRNSLADALQENAAPHGIVTNGDIDFELKLLAMWLVNEYMKEGDNGTE